MFVKVLVAYYILLISLNSMCEGRNFTHEAILDLSDRYSNAVARYEPGFFVLNNFIRPIVAMVGLCGNVVVLVVWSAETAFNPTTFLVKCLAVVDIITLLAYMCHWVRKFMLRLEWTIAAVVPYIVMLCNRPIIVYTTLGVAVTRWVTVHKPLRVHSLLTRRRVVVGYILMLLWCLISGISLCLLLAERSDDDYIAIMNTAWEGVNLALPILLLVVLNVSLVYTVCSHRHSSHSSLGQQRQRTVRSARLLGAVLSVSISTVLAYPVGVAYRLLKFGLGVEICDSDCAMKLLAVTFLRETFNSSINVVYYLVFASRFRQLCRLRCGCCCRRCSF